jgi:3-isopropylmalate/(R)-2-methylmalate dehydratase small subunit
LTVEPFTILTGAAAPLMLANVDTDVIIRIEHLTSGDDSTLGRHAFEALRYFPDGSERPEFVLNQATFRGAPILIAGSNFGCGSSREAAVVALRGLGIRCVIADKFGDIFFGNCFQNGLLPIRLPAPEVTELARRAAAGATFTVDLAVQTITVTGISYPFTVDARRREALLEGLDDLGLSLKQMDLIRAWQQQDRAVRPWLWNAD